MEIYERIKARRKEIGLSAEAVAQKLGVSPATIYRYENNDIKKFPTDILTPLAKVLRTTPSYLLGVENQEAKSSDFALSSHEKDLVVAYRENPNMQSAVDTLLGISTASTVHTMEAPHQIYRAARSTDHHEHTIQTRSASDIEKLTNAPKVTSDDDL